MDYDVMINEGNFQDTFLEARENSGMNRKLLAEYFRIPYRTMQDWELENR